MSLSGGALKYSVLEDNYKLFVSSAPDLRKDFQVNLVITGLKRILGDASKPKDPLFPDDLKCIYKYVNMDSDVERAVWISVHLCFRTLLRKCHMLSSGDLDTHLLRWEDVLFMDKGFRLNVLTSKNNQFRQRTFTAPVMQSKSPRFCLVRQFKVYMDSVPVSPKTPLICDAEGNGISYVKGLHYLKLWCDKAGLDKDIGYHSLRRGAATHMHMLGVNLQDIKLAGDWQSMCVLLYLTTPMEHRQLIDLKIANSY